MTGMRVAGAIAIGMGWLLLANPSWALPGQTPEEVAVWVQAHPTLRPAPGEKLLVRKTNTPAQRFTFQASAVPVGRVSIAPSRIVRTEELSLFDMVHGVNQTRLEESLRVIYGSSVYQDYAQSTVVYRYPPRPTGTTALKAALRGEIREGDRYAYWLEIAAQPNGFSYTGKLTVFLRTDLPKLLKELDDR